MPTQRELLHQYNEKYRDDFNPIYFNRENDAIINALRNVVLSCQRNSNFLIQVTSFNVIEDYNEVMNRLKAYEEEHSKKKEKFDNPYDYINLKPSSYILIEISYHLGITEKKDGWIEDDIMVYIVVPRVIDGKYFLINGNKYVAMYQIVDASTYNNTASKAAKNECVTLKTQLMPIRLYAKSTKLITIDNEEIQCQYFDCYMFNKRSLTLKYYLSKFGYYGTQEILNICGVCIIPNNYSNQFDKNQFYIFKIKDRTDYVVAPKVLYDNNKLVQSFVYTIIDCMHKLKNKPWVEFFSTDTWQISHGMDFTTNKDMYKSKGMDVTASLDNIYDIETKDDLHLPEQDKANIYTVIRWMMYEYKSLRNKDNLDITTKKVRYAEYIAGYYATKLAKGIYSLSDKSADATMKLLKRKLQIPPMYLINIITKSQLVNYNDCVNDLDSFNALRWTYKGDQGIGENSSAIAASYRDINPSHLGRVELDSSSNSDPGVSGTLCPLGQIYDGHFSEYSEPSTWREEVSGLMEMYSKMNNKIQMCEKLNSDLPLYEYDNMDLLSNTLRYVLLASNELSKTI